MKSVIQEASSLLKAIEQAWEKAGKPKDFSVRIFQEAHRNFLGMATQNAKIAFFFDQPIGQRPLTQQPQRVQRRPLQQTQGQGQDRRRQQQGPRRRTYRPHGGQTRYNQPYQQQPQRNVQSGTNQQSTTTPTAQQTENKPKPQ